MITCQACGTVNPSDAAFCSKCARKLDADTQQSVVQRRESHTATGIRWSAVIFALILLLLLALVLAFVLPHVM
ncbi:MAG: hypothetical protein NVSMB52_05190 [Chloroflexota bacterium]